MKVPSWALLQSDSELIHGNRGWKQNWPLTPHFFPRVPLRKHQSVRKKLRAQGVLSDFWKSQNLDMVQFSESCKMDQSTNEPLINYLDVRCLGLKPGYTGSREEGWVSRRDQCCIGDVKCSGMGHFAWMTQVGNPVISVNSVKQASVWPSAHGFKRKEIRTACAPRGKPLLCAQLGA